MSLCHSGCWVKPFINHILISIATKRDKVDNLFLVKNDPVLFIETEEESNEHVIKVTRHS